MAFPTNCEGLLEPQRCQMYSEFSSKINWRQNICKIHHRGELWWTKYSAHGIKGNVCSPKNTSFNVCIITITSKFFDIRAYPSLCSWISSLSSGGVMLAILHKTGFKQRCPLCSVTMKILECKLRVLSQYPYLFLKSLFFTVHGVYTCSFTFWWCPMENCRANYPTWTFSLECTIDFNWDHQ